MPHPLLGRALSQLAPVPAAYIYRRLVLAEMSCFVVCILTYPHPHQHMLQAAPLFFHWTPGSVPVPALCLGHEKPHLVCVCVGGGRVTFRVPGWFHGFPEPSCRPECEFLPPIGLTSPSTRSEVPAHWERMQETHSLLTVVGWDTRPCLLAVSSEP